MPDLNGVSVRGLENVWRDHVERKYGDIASLNVAWQTRYRTYDEIRLPALEQDWKILKEYKMAILWELVSRNYRVAWDAVVLNGNALRNTVIFCFLNVMIALVVNPLAAYALSRFQPSWGQGALFLLMATMAFPGEVTQIPAFLLLRDLGWLNTFAALVVPAAANGYSIFLLKGFFDSLPKELYEAATIDGSGELRAFFTITLPLSAPILAVVALAAFAAAYGAFMFALLVCQKESMWTLMVYIYQLQQSYNPPTVFAALVIAAIPTLVVFVLCQNIIMKGIVVPVEK
jgi:ABC-type glycerol-3-phosphate transport system permease component